MTRAVPFSGFSSWHSEHCPFQLSLPINAICRALLGAVTEALFNLKGPGNPLFFWKTGMTSDQTARLSFRGLVVSGEKLTLLGSPKLAVTVTAEAPPKLGMPAFLDCYPHLGVLPS